MSTPNWWRWAGCAVAAVLAAISPAPLGAQFASGLTPPPAPPPPEVVAAAESTAVARRDSVVRAQRLDMRAWVDSAAASLERGSVPAVVPVPGAPVDSVRRVPPAAAPPRTPPIARAVAPRPTVRHTVSGVVPPDTASALPTLTMLGSGMFMSGMVLLKRRRPRSLDLSRTQGQLRDR